jgi:prolyl-tRNA synthetase
MYLSQTTITQLRETVEKEGGFQIALAPMQPVTFLNVKIATDKLYQQLVSKGLKVLVDDRGQKPKNMFEVIEFLRIRHRVVISSRSISAGVYEYKDLQTGHFSKIKEEGAFNFLLNLPA